MISFDYKYQIMKRRRVKEVIILNPPSRSAGNISIALPVKALAKIVKRCFISFSTTVLIIISDEVLYFLAKTL